MSTTWLFLGVAGLLIAAALIVPSNNLTGHVVKEQSCGSLGCSELCDPDGQSGASVCDGGAVCCMTHWQTGDGKAQGLCDYSTNCEKIREYSLYQSLETYQDGVREKPSEIDASWGRFILPLLLCLGIVVYFVFKRNGK